MTFFTFPSFIVCLLFSGVLPWYFTCKYIVQIHLTFLLLFFTFPPPCIVQQFSVHFLVSCSYIDVMYFNIIHYHSLLHPPLLVSPNSSTVETCSHIYIFAFIFHIGEKICDFCLSEHRLLHLTWYSSVPSIYLWATKFHSSLWLNNISLYIHAYTYLCICMYISHFYNPFLSYRTCRMSLLYPNLHFIYIGYMSGKGIGGSYSSSMLSVLKNLHTDFQVVILIYIPSNRVWGSFFPNPYQHFLWFVFCWWSCWLE
jgi:hypothetical protein